LSTNSSQPNSGTGTKASEFLSNLAAVGGTVGIVANVAGIVIPLIGGVIKKIEASATDGGEVEYTLVLSTTQAKLDADVAVVNADIADINSELAKLGLPPLSPIVPQAEEPAPPAGT